MRIKMEDLVEVITGDDRGQRGRVLSVDRRAGKLIVEGINQVYKHVRRSQRNPQGGRLSKEMPIPVGNVQLVCEKCGRPTRIGARYNERGAKERFCKRCGVNLGEIAPAKTSYAREK